MYNYKLILNIHILKIQDPSAMMPKLVCTCILIYGVDTEDLRTPRSSVNQSMHSSSHKTTCLECLMKMVLDPLHKIYQRQAAIKKLLVQ